MSKKKRNQEEDDIFGTDFMDDFMDDGGDIFGDDDFDDFDGFDDMDDFGGDDGVDIFGDEVDPFKEDEPPKRAEGKDGDPKEKLSGILGSIKEKLPEDKKSLVLNGMIVLLVALAGIRAMGFIGGEKAEKPPEDVTPIVKDFEQEDEKPKKVKEVENDKKEKEEPKAQEKEKDEEYVDFDEVESKEPPRKRPTTDEEDGEEEEQTVTLTEEERIAMENAIKGVESSNREIREKEEAERSIEEKTEQKRLRREAYAYSLSNPDFLRHEIEDVSNEGEALEGEIHLAMRRYDDVTVVRDLVEYHREFLEKYIPHMRDKGYGDHELTIDGINYRLLNMRHSGEDWYLDDVVNDALYRYFDSY